MDLGSLFGTAGSSMGAAGLLGPLGMVGGAALSSFMTSKANKEAKKRLNKAMGMVEEGESRQLTKTGQARRELGQAKIVARTQADASKRESLAATQAAQSMMNRQFGQQMAQASAMAGMRGLGGTTAGLAGMGAAMGGISNAIAQMQMQGAQQRIGINTGLTGTLANLAGQTAGMFGKEADIIGANASARANMLAGFSPTVDTSAANLLSGLGGQLFGAGLQHRMGADFASTQQA